MHEQLNFSDLVENASQLNSTDYERFLVNVSEKRVQKQPNVLKENEEILLKKIYKLFPIDKKERIAELNEKKWSAEISKLELQELIKLIDLKEKWAAQRMLSLAKLSKIRNESYATLTQKLGIPQIPHNG
jgi:hypothetical protein